MKNSKLSLPKCYIMQVDTFFSVLASFRYIHTGNTKSFRSLAFCASGPELKRIYLGKQSVFRFMIVK